MNFPKKDRELEQVPKDIENIIYEYRNQLEKTERFDKVVEELNHIVRCETSVAWNEHTGFGVVCVSIDKFDRKGFKCLVCSRFCLQCGKYYGQIDNRPIQEYQCECNPEERVNRYSGYRTNLDELFIANNRMRFF